jgi:hypothetical protein
MPPQNDGEELNLHQQTWIPCAVNYLKTHKNLTCDYCIFNYNILPIIHSFLVVIKHQTLLACSIQVTLSNTSQFKIYSSFTTPGPKWFGLIMNEEQLRQLQDQIAKRYEHELHVSNDAMGSRPASPVIDPILLGPARNLTFTTIRSNSTNPTDSGESSVSITGGSAFSPLRPSHRRTREEPESPTRVDRPNPYIDRRLAEEFSDELGLNQAHRDVLMQATRVSGHMTSTIICY